MSSSCNQIDSIVKITKHKYLWAIAPIAIILFSLLLNHIFPDNKNILFAQKILSGISLILYFFVSLTHRISKQNCDIESGMIYCPINGIIKDVKSDNDFTEIVIKKSFFDRCDIRSCFGETMSDSPLSEKKDFGEWEVLSGKSILLEDKSIPKGIVAFATGKLLVKMKLKKGIEIKVKIGEKVISGNTVLGEKIEVC